MKSKVMVIGLGVLLCCIPILIFFVFRGQKDEVDSTNDFESYERNSHPVTAWPLEQENEHYKITLSPVGSVLKRGKQRLKLRIETFSLQPPVARNPEVHILMPLGKDTITAPIKTQKLAQGGQYQLQTQFDTAGEWELDVKPDRTSNPMQFHFQVEL
jgi:YtkA-like